MQNLNPNPNFKVFVDPEFETYHSLAEMEAGVTARYQNGWSVAVSVTTTTPTLTITVGYSGPAPNVNP